ncbi:hypothetical protein BJY01DRAFT_181623 [Aspergillus pseudoustus]|uniref:Uncharacterized protein n=1 Tax=Aspergillus pseudoustus TaxID=1810923 RepID=A0ABR4JZK3_9EURO
MLTVLKRLVSYYVLNWKREVNVVLHHGTSPHRLAASVPQAVIPTPSTKAEPSPKLKANLIQLQRCWGAYFTFIDSCIS